MATKKTADSVQVQAPTEEQTTLDVLTGIIDKDTRMYTMNKRITIHGDRKEGTFRFRYPTVRDRLQQGVAQSRLLGGISVASVDVATYNIAFTMSFLMAIAEQLPPWFTFEAMESVDELLEMFTEVNAFINSFRPDDASDGHDSGSETAAGTKTVANS